MFSELFHEDFLEIVSGRFDSIHIKLVAIFKMVEKERGGYMGLVGLPRKNSYR